MPDSFPEDYDQTTRDWYIGAVNTNAVFVTEPYIDVFTSSLVVSLSKAIRNPDGSLKGVAGLDVLASKVDELMNQINNESDYEFYMVLSDGRYMSHTNKEYLLIIKNHLYHRFFYYLYFYYLKFRSDHYYFHLYLI